MTHRNDARPPGGPDSPSDDASAPAVDGTAASVDGATGPTEDAATNALDGIDGGEPIRSDPPNGPAPALADADPEAELDRIGAFLREFVDGADADGVVVNMSGGLDSTVTAALAVEALGADRVYGLILPCNKTGDASAHDAEAIAEALGIAYDAVHLQPLFAQFGSLAPDRFDLHDEPTLVGNAVARLRMTTAYLAANATNRIVCGTTNRSERLLGYFTKHGDGAADLLPIGHLYKTEVRALARALELPAFVVEKPPTAGFAPGQVDRDDLGSSYDTIDPVLRLLVDEGLAPADVADRLGVDRETVDRLGARHERTAHKRRRPPTPTEWSGAK